MKTNFLTLASLFLMATTGGMASAETSGSEAPTELSPAAMEILCESFPLNSRCAGQTSAEPNAPVSEEPAFGAPTDEVPTEAESMEAPVGEEPIEEIPAEEEVMEEPASEAESMEAPVGEEPIEEIPAEEEVMEEPASEAESMEAPVGEEPIEEIPAEEEVMEEPASEAPAEEVLTDPSASEAPAEETIVELASANESFKTLTAAIQAAGLTETLSGEGPFTVFAPSEEAFAALPPGAIDLLLKPENKDKLVKILTYHVVPTKAVSSDLESGEVNTVAGAPVKVTVAEGAVQVNNAAVVEADVMGSNGVIHVIDKVLLPPNLMN